MVTLLQSSVVSIIAPSPLKDKQTNYLWQSLRLWSTSPLKKSHLFLFVQPHFYYMVYACYNDNVSRQINHMFCSQVWI